MMTVLLYSTIFAFLALRILFQLDTLIFTPKIAVILEIKNIAGILQFDPQFSQLVRTLNEKEEGMPSPILQIERQEVQLRNWLNRHNQKNLPIAAFVVFSNPATIIKTPSPNTFLLKRIVHAEHLPTKLNTLFQNGKGILTSKEIRKLTNTLIKEHRPHTPNLLEKYKIPVSAIIPGVHCPGCQKLSMKRERGTWHCLYCSKKDKIAHVQALIDFALLIQPTITNEQFRSFTFLSSASVSSKILKSLSIPYEGNYRYRSYNLISLLHIHLAFLLPILYAYFINT
ncbi:NERD domain-containing protein [Metabacillus sp. GX 13764]|uniref:nuclease-related domain-containing protein n=1 Tax=Metabacillus kandeliae TaxID=2900151 RepID=UPI001E2C1D37|nr:nuclease-related domain-containing protein [Metabacillus kandeliae]MCD7033845.1 NERD domain-containing protein [Metabacillus kandeliae]